MKEASYSDIDIRSSSESHSNSRDASPSEGTSLSDGEDSISIRSSGSHVKKKGPSSTKVRRREKSSKKLISQMKQVTEEEDELREVQLITRGADGKAIVKIIRKSASSLSAESISEEGKKKKSKKTSSREGKGSVAIYAGPSDSSSAVASSDTKTQEGPSAHIDSVPGASSKFSVSPSPTRAKSLNVSPSSPSTVVELGDADGGWQSKSAKSSARDHSFWPVSSSPSETSVSVFPTVSNNSSNNKSREREQEKEERAQSSKSTRQRSSASLRRAFFADLNVSPEVLLEEEEEFTAKESTDIAPVRKKESSKIKEESAVGPGKGKYISRCVKEQFDIEVGPSESSEPVLDDSPSRVTLIQSAKGASLAWAKPAGIRAFLKASFRSSKSQSVDVTMAPEVDSSDDKSVSSATSTPIHSARQASESSHLLPSASASSSSSSSAIAKRSKRMKSSKSLQSPVTSESIPLPVVVQSSSTQSSYQPSAPPGHSSPSSSSQHPPHHPRSHQVTSPSSLPLSQSPSPSPSPSTSMLGSGLRATSYSSSSMKRRSPSSSLSKRRASSAATVVSVSGPGASSSATVTSLPRPPVGSLAHSPSAGKRFL